MESIAKPIKQLFEDSGWFARAHELRLLTIQVDAELRTSALDILAKREFHADNYSPWTILDDAYLAENDGWLLRANRLQAEHERRRDACAKEGVPLDAAPPRREQPGVLGFAALLGDLLGTLHAPMRGWVIVLAPTMVTNRIAYEYEVEALIHAPALSSVRWVVVDSELAPLETARVKLVRAAIHSTVHVDPDDQAAELSAMVAAAAPSGGLSFGHAGPRGVRPPARVDDPPRPDPAQFEAALRAKGIDPRYLEQAPMLRQCLLGAALAMREGRGAEAVELQRQSLTICETLGLHEQRVICQMTVGSYLLALRNRADAQQEYEQAAVYAEQHQVPVQAALARMGLAALYGIDEAYEHAANEYITAARWAEHAQSELITIECWRLAGQHQLNRLDYEAAHQCFLHSIRVAEGAPAKIQQTSSAPEAARRLASLFAERSMHAHAQALYDQADRIERGETEQRGVTA
jgi:tetratricopeptide (TPR) repeat protein